MNIFKVYVVVGGVQGLEGNTEIYIDNVEGPSSWQTIDAPLPFSTNGLKAVHFNNTILTFGKSTYQIYQCLRKTLNNRIPKVSVPSRRIFVWR